MTAEEPNRGWWQRLGDRRAERNRVPFTDTEMELLREVPAEGKAIRRHRRKARLGLKSQGGQSW